MRLRRKLLLFAIPAASGAMGAYAQDDAPQARLLEQGRSLYAQQCARCHGYNMVNDGGYAFDLRTFPVSERARFFASVTKGKGTNMPPWGDVLAAGEIEALWAYVQWGEKSR